MRRAHVLSLVSIASVALLVLSSGIAASHDDHGASAPTTPLEPSDEPERFPLAVGGTGAAITLATGWIHAKDAISRRVTGIGLVVGVSLLGLSGLLALGVL